MNKKLISTYDSKVIEVITTTVANYFGLTVPQMFEKRRERGIVVPRQLCHSFARKHTNLSLAEVGMKIGEKDHSTVVYSCKTINILKGNNEQIRMNFSFLNAEIIYRKGKL